MRTKPGDAEIKASRLEVALQYCSTLQWSVMPVSRTGNKRPCVKWKPYQSMRADSARLKQWFDDWQDANVGLITGEISGCFVVETDSETAHEWLSSQELPPGPIAQSSQPYKQHFYFRHPGFRVANSQSVIGQNIDVRGDGGYVVVPPSIHSSGVVYQWIVSPFDCPLPDAPRWLLDLIVKKVETAPDVPPPAPLRPDDPRAGRLEKYATGALNREVQDVATAPDGRKHEVLRNSAISLGTLVPHGILSAQDIEQHLFAAIAPRAKDKANARQTIRDGINYGCHFPRELPAENFPQENRSCTTPPGRTPRNGHAPAPTNGSNGTNANSNGNANANSNGSYSLVSAPEYSDGLGMKPDATEMETEPIETEAEPKPLYETFTFSDLVKMPRPEWLIRNLLVEKGSSILSADSGSFKSFIALAMGLCIATGHEFVCSEVKQGPVVYVAAEGFYTLRDRAEAWAIYHGVELPENFHILKVPVNLAEPAIVLQFANHIASLSPIFVVLDTLSQNAIGLNENDNAQMANFMRGMMTLGDRIGAHVQVLHHNAKSTGTYRGAVSIKANVDTHIALERSEGDYENRVLVRCDKQRGRPFTMFALEGEEVTLPYCDEYGDPVTSLVFELTDVEDIANGNSQKAEYDSKIAERYKERLMEVFDHCAIDAERFGGGVMIGRWFAAACPEDEPSARVCNKTTFFKYREMLEKEGVIEPYDYAGKSPLFRRKAVPKERVRQGSPEFARTETNQSEAVGSARYQHPPKGGLNHANQLQRTDTNCEPDNQQTEIF